MQFIRFNPAELSRATAGRRRTWVLGLTLTLTLPAVYLIGQVDLNAHASGWGVLHIALFTILFSLVAFGAVQATVGLFVRRRGGDPYSILRSVDFETDTGALDVPVAVVMPICNEDVKRVFEGWRTVYQSVLQTEKLPNCDFFLLSDSNKPNHWVEEEATWLATIQQLGAEGRMFYRRRRVGINKKAGNIADFCRRWGKHYRYMIVLDADSIMSGEAIVKLVRLMERNRRVGLIQAVPLLVNGETILARLQQFATRLYGPIFSAGLNFWQLSEANYWGHNAIIRLAPFIRHCSLPELPGDGPFGGRILSHDYVEAALMRRAGWQVWLATDIEGNFEECPANIIDLAKRDRRWLQGNLQHLKLIFARGFHNVNRVHFSLGILSYLASPLWLFFLLLSVKLAWQTEQQGSDALQRLHGSGLLSAVPLGTIALSLFVFTTVLLLLPKVIALIDLSNRPEERARFGGWGTLSLGIFLETVIFTLLAPILMMFHSKFIALTLLRQNITWGSQRRGREGSSAWRESFFGHLDQTIIGVIAAVLILRLEPAIAVWMSPVLAGLIFSIPLSYFTGSLAAGHWFRRKKIFITPLETAPEKEIVQVAQEREEGEDEIIPDELVPDYGLLQATLDPQVNAAHVALLRTKEELPPSSETRFEALRNKLLVEGPDALKAQEKVALLSDAESMMLLHESVWERPASQLAPWWQLALAYYSPAGPLAANPFH